MAEALGLEAFERICLSAASSALDYYRHHFVFQQLALWVGICPTVFLTQYLVDRPARSLREILSVCDSSCGSFGLWDRTD